jgi:hypothetical protein
MEHTGELTRYFLKHKKDGGTYAVEADEHREIVACLDVTDDAKRGGVCPHLLAGLPLASHRFDVDALNKNREDFERFDPDCGNTHHLLADLVAMEGVYRESVTRWESADGTAKAFKKVMEGNSERVHELLNRIRDRKPLPLFEQAEAEAPAPVGV